MVDIILHRKRKTEQHEPLKTGEISGAQEK
jgi:hypothetical protein